MVDKLEVIYYEMLKMEDRITQKADAILKARDEIETMLKRQEGLQKELLEALQKSLNKF